MWYTVLREEVKLSTSYRNQPGLREVLYKAGTVMSATKRENDLVRLDRMKGPDEFVDSSEFIIMTTNECKEYLTKPTKDFDDAIEESFMVCEAAYC